MTIEQLVNLYVGDSMPGIYIYDDTSKLFDDKNWLKLFQDPNCQVTEWSFDIETNIIYCHVDNRYEGTEEVTAQELIKTNYPLSWYKSEIEKKLYLNNRNIISWDIDNLNDNDEKIFSHKDIMSWNLDNITKEIINNEVTLKEKFKLMVCVNYWYIKGNTLKINLDLYEDENFNELEN